MKNKKEIVKMLLRKEVNASEEEDLINLLIDDTVSVDVDKEELKNMKKGDKLSDKMAEVVGSWGFILGFVLFIIIWVILNLFFIKLDIFPFILLNLVLSCIAAIQAPIIMMSQNRQAKKDSLRNQNDYRIDLKSELILEALHDHIEEVLKNQRKIIKELEKNKE